MLKSLSLRNVPPSLFSEDFAGREAFLCVDLELLGKSFLLIKPKVKMGD